MIRYHPFLPLLLSVSLFSACSSSGVERSENVAGTYSRTTSISCTGADIDISLLPDGRYAVRGLATWCPDEESGEQGIVHVGELDFAAPLVDSILRYDDVEMGYSVEVKALGNRLEVVENGGEGYHGHNVTFEGSYQRKDGE